MLATCIRRAKSRFTICDPDRPGRLGSIAAVLNGFLGYGGQYLADSMRLRLQTYGATVPAVTVMALSLPPLFYFVGAAALVCAVLGFRRIMADNKMLYIAIAFLVFDIAILFASHYAFTYVAIRTR